MPQRLTNMPYVTAYPSGRLWNRLTPFSIRTCAFPRFDTVFEAVSEWFPEVRPERRTDFCLKVLSPAEAVFGKYSIDDRFESSPACLYTYVELTVHTILYRTIWHITDDNIWRTT